MINMSHYLFVQIDQPEWKQRGLLRIRGEISKINKFTHKIIQNNGEKNITSSGDWQKPACPQALYASFSFFFLTQL
jgi:hypothetical protein